MSDDGLDRAVRSLQETVRRLDLKQARRRAATGVAYSDDGGLAGGGDIDLQTLITTILTGTLGAYLTVVGGGKGIPQALGTLGATEVIDLANGNYFWGTLDQDCAISTVGWTNLKDCQISVELIQDGTGGWLPTFSGVTWIGTAPTSEAAGTVTHIILLSRDGGTTIYGAVVGGGGSGGASSTDTMAWMPLTTFVAGVPDLVWDASDSLIPTLTPI